MKAKIMSLLMSAVLIIAVVSCPAGPKAPTPKLPDPVVPAAPVTPMDGVDGEVSQDDMTVWAGKLSSLVECNVESAIGTKKNEVNQKITLAEDKTEPVSDFISGEDSTSVTIYKSSYSHSLSDADGQTRGIILISGKYGADNVGFKFEADITMSAGGATSGSAKYTEGNKTQELDIEKLNNNTFVQGDPEYKANKVMNTLMKVGSGIVVQKYTYDSYSDNEISGTAIKTESQEATVFQYQSDKNVTITINDVKLTVRYNIKTELDSKGSSYGTVTNGSYMQIKKEGENKFKSFDVNQLGLVETSTSGEGENE